MKIGRIALVVALLAAGCSDSTTSPATTNTTTTITEGFVDSLSVNEAKFKSFSVSQAGDAKVTLASLTAASAIGTTSPPDSTVVRIGVGVTSTDGLSCAVTSSVDVAPGFTAQLTASVPVGSACVQIADFGNLPATVKFIIRIVHT